MAIAIVMINDNSNNTNQTRDHRVTSQTEKQQTAGKETKQLRHFEENLLYNYKMYLQILESCISELFSPGCFTHSTSYTTLYFNLPDIQTGNPSRKKGEKMSKLEQVRLSMITMMGNNE